MNYKFADWQESRRIIESISVSSGEAIELFPVEFYKHEGKHVYYMHKEYPNIFISGAAGIIVKAEEDNFIERTRIFFEAQKDGTYLFNLEKVLNNSANYGIIIYKKLKGETKGEFYGKEDWSFQPRNINVDCQLVRNFTKQIVFHIYPGTMNSQAFLLYLQGLSRHHCTHFKNEPEQTDFGKKFVLSLIANRFNVDVDNNIHIGPNFKIPTFYENRIPDELLVKFKEHIEGDNLVNLILNKLKEDVVDLSAYIYASAEDLHDLEYPIVLKDDFNLFDTKQNEKILALSPKEVYVKLEKPNPFIKHDLENLTSDITFIFDDEITEDALNKKLNTIMR